MSVTFGFYNSLNNDRLYNATHFSNIFNGIINDGVFMSIGDHFFVAPNVSLGGLNIVVGSGRAWFNGTWTYNDAALPLTPAAAGVSLNRIDTVVLEIDASSGVRANSIKIVQGTPAASPVAPTLINTAEVHQYALAHLSITANLVTITAGQITNVVGSAPCPYVTGILDTIDIATMVASWQSQFYTWFNDLVNELDSNQVTNLQAQINVLEAIAGPPLIASQSLDFTENAGLPAAVANKIKLQNQSNKLMLVDEAGVTYKISGEGGVTLVVDNGEEVITTGTKLTGEVSYNMALDTWVITSMDLTTGSIALILETISYANFSGGAWTTIDTLTMTSANKATGTFTAKNLVKGDIMRIRIASTPTSVKKVALSLKGRRN